MVHFCISMVSFSIVLSLNGRPLKGFKPQRRLRQGDPLSPYHFILCSEVLSKLLEKEEREGNLHGISIARHTPTIYHLIFADDTILFCRATAREVNASQRCLYLYESWSGEMINRDKPGVFFSKNTPEGARDEIGGITGIPRAKSHMMHLGNRLFPSSSRVRDFQGVKERALNRIENWKTKLLSQTERSTLIKGVVSSVPMYTMTTFKVPSSICEANSPCSNEEVLVDWQLR